MRFETDTVKIQKAAGPSTRRLSRVVNSFEKVKVERGQRILIHGARAIYPRLEEPKHESQVKEKI